MRVGDGDYWVFDESFSTENVSIIKFYGRDVSVELQVALQMWLDATPNVTTVSLHTEDGDVLFKAKKLTHF
jgi:hypothetical protein